MRVSRLPYSFLGRFTVSLIGGVLMQGAAGCTNLQLSLSGLGGTSSLFGFLVNSDTSSELLGALRIADGQNVYVYGTHQPDGNIGDVQAALFRDADGHEAVVNFDGGLLRKAKSFDGSTLNVTYDERTTSRLRGHVDVFIAAADTANQNQTINFDIDLAQAAQQFAQQIKDVTGIDVSTTPPPDDPGSRVKTPDARHVSAADRNNGQFIFLFYPFFVYAVAVSGYLMVQVMAQLMEVMVHVLVAVTQAMIIAVCAPFILMAELMRGVVGLPILGVNILVELAKQGVTVPRQPFL